MTNMQQRRGSGIVARPASPAVALVAALAVAAVFTPLAHAQTYSETVIHTFTGGADGIGPDGLIGSGAGNLYGATEFGGAGPCYDGFISDCGTVLKIDFARNETILYTFQGGTDGAYPESELVRDSKGNIYGTTYQGGGPANDGTVFKLDTAGNETVLHSFTGGRDGRYPRASLIRGSAGNLYGTTVAGGAELRFRGVGVIFKVNPAGKESVLYAFEGHQDGAYPGGMIQDGRGNFFGTTGYGGTGNCSNVRVHGCGTVFELDKAGKERVLYSFAGGTDGNFPSFGVTQDAAGNLYGVTDAGGTGQCNSAIDIGCGTVFKVDKSGNHSVLYSFTGAADGALPTSQLVLDASGNLYGTTGYGGSSFYTSGYGVVFKLDTSGKQTVLYTFKGGSDGRYPGGNLLLNPKGILYGTTGEGGDTSCAAPYGCGVVFQLTQQ